MELWEKFYDLGESIEDKEYTLEEMKNIQTSWKDLSKVFLNHIKIDDLLDMFTYLNSTILADNQTGNELLQEFASYLCYASDRMNINRWCRLQLTLENAINNRYWEENKYND